ncbi:MAG: hypothetical protein JST54_19330 [Deltaproteobacteria bacterium]|nr:hypothetical protein [Deltaproteobacteria bacterium]
MRRLAVALILLGSGVAWADPSPRVIAGLVRPEAGAAVAAGTDTVSISAWIEKPDLTRTASVSFVYRWLGVVSGTERFKMVMQKPNLSIFFRDYSSASVYARGGTTVGLSKGFGLGFRAGPESGVFSAVLSPSAQIDGFWVIREGTSGISARVPLGLELAMTGRYARVVPFALVRGFEDVWLHRSPAYRYEALAGVGLTFDLPGPREKGKPLPPGP